MNPSTFVKGLEYFVVFLGLCGGVAGFSFWLAGLEIKSKINLEISKQFSQIALEQTRLQSQSDVEFANLMSKIRGWIDNNAMEIGLIKQQIEQIEQVLERDTKYNRRARLSADKTLPEDTSF